MKISDEAYVISTNGLKKVLLIYLAVLAGFGLSGPLMVAFEISRAPEALEFPSVVSVVSPALQAFASDFRLRW